ncbi:MAG TPA: hypothetical protein VFK78_13135 [Gemmatimonadales bacterium]|nr:hypothetical protein [Gemmatimonadales bacterium]
MWILAVILIVALLIPIVAIVVDSPLGRSFARRLEGRSEVETGGTDVRELRRKVETLETEVDDLNRSIAGMKDELQFVQRLLEDPNRKRA